MSFQWMKNRLTAQAFREARSLTAALLCCIGTRMFAIDQRTISSQSMYPALNPGDRILVDKASVVWGKLPGRPSGLGLRRGDVVVFKPPEASRPLYEELLHAASGKETRGSGRETTSLTQEWRRRRALRRTPLNSKLDFTKRVVALAGDRVAVRRGVLYVNGRPADPSPRASSSSRAGRSSSRGGPDGGSTHQDSPARRASYSMGATVVPERRVVVLGDNRDASFDSHVWGPLPVGNIVGLAKARYWPLSRATWFGRGHS